MPEYVRVTDTDTGHKLTVLRSELDHGNYRELSDEAALDHNGDPLAPEFNVEEPTPAPNPHESKTVDELKAEIDARNADRDPEGDTYITPEAPANKPQLVAALTADDE